MIAKAIFLIKLNFFVVVIISPFNIITLLVYSKHAKIANKFLLFVNNIFMKITKNKSKTLFAIVCGVFVGFVNGLFGGGGGMICVPFLESVLKMETKYAHATTLCVILPISLVSSLVYINKNSINLLTLLVVTLGAILGGIIGAIILKKLNSRWTKVVFAVLMLAVGIKMVI